MTMDPGIIYIVIGLALGGILKGATGAGAPVVAVPVMALFYSVPLAIVIFIVPNLVANSWQLWKHRAHRLPMEFTAKFCGMGAFGAGLGTVMLASLSGSTLKVIVALAVFVYIGFRLMKPDWVLAYSRALKVSWFMGGIAGAMQGATGLSTPVSITFLNSMRLERPQFIFTISGFFIATLLVQFPMLLSYGFLTPQLMLLSCGAAVILLVFMPVGSFLAKHLSRKVFDRLILGLLAILGTRLLFEALS